MNEPARQGGKRMTIVELENRIRACQKAYYNGEPLIPDTEFDLLWDELKRTNPESPVLRAVGASATSRFPKVQHIIPMGSLDKTCNPDEFMLWASCASLFSYVVQHKLDGASLELQYAQGKLVRAVTRGDGKTGNDITPNARLMEGVIQDMAVPFTGGVRGEVVMTREVWEEKYADKNNRRNTANGIMLRKDGSGCGDLSFIAYDAGAAGGNGFLHLETAKITWLKDRGFSVVDTRVFDTPEEVIAYHSDITKKRASLPVDIDGLVVKDRITDAADIRRCRPERQIAFKFRTQEASE